MMGSLSTASSNCKCKYSGSLDFFFFKKVPPKRLYLGRLALKKMNLRSTTKNLPLLALFCVHSHQRSHHLFSPLLCCGGFPILSLPYSLLSATCSFLCFQHWFSASPIHFCFYLICFQCGWQQLFILNHSLSLQSSSVLVSPHFCVLLGPDLCYFKEPQSSEALGDQGENTHRNLDTHTHRRMQVPRTVHTQTQNMHKIHVVPWSTLSHLQILCLVKCQILTY